MSRDPRLFLEDIQGSCLKILRYTQDLDFASFCAEDILGKEFRNGPGK